MTDQNAFNELCAITGQQCIIGEDIPERYFEPWRGKIGSAIAIVFPESIEHIQKTITWAKNECYRLLPQGARTGLVDASVPSKENSENSVIVSFEKYRSNMKINVQDQRLIVDAGFLLSEVNEYLKTFGYFLPVNVSSDPMVGAMASTNIGGSSVLRHGDFRSLMKGIQVVLADVDLSVYDSLQRPIKDNSSLNFTQSFCGSFGQLGFITSVALKVFPIEKASTTYWIPLSNDENTALLVNKLESISGDLLVACEMVSSNVLKATNENYSELNSKIVIPYVKDQVDVLFVEFATTLENDDIKNKGEEILAKLVELGLVDDALNLDSSKTWEIRHSFSESVRNFSRKLITCDISTTKDKFFKLRTSIHKEISKIYPDLVICDFGHVGDGGIHMNIAIPKSLSDVDFSDEDVKKIRRVVNDITNLYGGSFSAEHGLGALNSDYYHEYIPKVDKLLTRSLKIFCDPENILGHSSIDFITGE